MIHKGNKEIVSIYLGGKNIVAIYKGNNLVYQSVRSSFGSGYWVNEKPWSNTEGWKN